MNRKGLNGWIDFFQKKIENFSLKKINPSKKIPSSTPFCEAKTVSEYLTSVECQIVIKFVRISVIRGSLQHK